MEIEQCICFHFHNHLNDRTPTREIKVTREIKEEILKFLESNENKNKQTLSQPLGWSKDGSKSSRCLCLHLNRRILRFNELLRKETAGQPESGRCGK